MTVDETQAQIAAAARVARENPRREVVVTSAADLAHLHKQAAEHRRQAARIEAELAKAEALSTVEAST